MLIVLDMSIVEDCDCWLTEERVQNLHGSGGLRPFGEFADV